MCFVGRAALIFPSPPNNSSDLFIGLMRMRGDRSFTYVSVRCSLVVAVDAGREGSGLRGEEYFRLPLYIPEMSRRLENMCREEEKKTLRRPGHVAPHGLFLEV